MKNFDFIEDDFLLEELEELKEEDYEFYDSLVKYLRRNRNLGTEYLTSFINHQLFGE